MMVSRATYIWKVIGLNLLKDILPPQVACLGRSTDIEEQEQTTESWISHAAWLQPTSWPLHPMSSFCFVFKPIKQRPKDPRSVRRYSCFCFFLTLVLEAGFTPLGYSFCCWKHEQCLFVKSCRGWWDSSAGRVSGWQAWLPWSLKPPWWKKRTNSPTSLPMSTPLRIQKEITLTKI